MINIVNCKPERNTISTKDGEITRLNKIHYFDEYDNEVFPICGEKYNFMGVEKTYPFN